MSIKADAGVVLNELEREVLLLRERAVRDARIICALLGRFKVKEITVGPEDAGIMPGTEDAPIGFNARELPDGRYEVKPMTTEEAGGMIEAQGQTKQ